MELMGLDWVLLLRCAGMAALTASFAWVITKGTPL